MGQTILVRQGGAAGASVVDFTPQSRTFAGDSTPLVDAGMMFGGDGNACQWQFPVDDRVAEIHAPGLKQLLSGNVVTVVENAPGFDCWIGRGRIADKGISRGGRGGPHRYFMVMVDDGNIDFRGLTLHPPWPLPPESSRARLLAALAAFCNGSPRLTTVIATHLVAAGGEVTMPPKTYPATTDLSDIFRDCAQTEGKFWGAVIHHVGGSHLCMLYITENDHSTFVSGLSITDDHPDLVTQFPPIWDSGDATLESGGDNPVSKLVSTYGVDEDFVVSTDAAVVDLYDYFAAPYHDSQSESPAQAQSRADSERSRRSREHITHKLSVQIPAGLVDQIGAGMSINIKSEIAMGGQYLGTFQTRRIAQCKFERLTPVVGTNQGYYAAHLELDRPEKRGREPIGSPALVKAKAALKAGTGAVDPHKVGVVTEGAALTIEKRTVVRADSDSGAYAWGGATTVIHAGAFLRDNVSWPNTPCGVSLGAWKTPAKRYLGLLVTVIAQPINALDVVLRLTVELGYGNAGQCPDFGHGDLGAYCGTAALIPGRYSLRYAGAGADFTGVDPEVAISLGAFTPKTGDVLEVSLPLGLVPWGQSARFVLVPEFAVSAGYACHVDLVDGNAAADSTVAASSISASPRTFDPSTPGWLTAGATGAQDGSNRAFTLPFAAAAVRRAWINGVLVGFTHTDNTASVTVDAAPLASDVLRFEAYVP